MNIIFKPECKTEIIEPTYDLPIIGEPISKTGASANNSNAYGVIVGIIGDGSSRRVRVMTKGYIDYDKVTGRNEGGCGYWPCLVCRNNRGWPYGRRSGFNWCSPGMVRTTAGVWMLYRFCSR